MAFDSTAELLFAIGANTDDAEENIQRFRQLLGTDLDQMAAQFSDWSKEVLGSLETVQGALTAGIAVIGAAMVGAAAFAVEASNKYVEFAEQVEKGTLRTGLAAEDMSKLMYAGKILGVGYDELVGGLTKFSSYIVKSATDTGYAGSAFQQLGITQAQVQAGEKDMLPLIGLVQDKMSGLANQTDRVAMSRELMARGGPGLMQMLQIDSAAMATLTKNAELLGTVMTEKGVVGAKQLSAQLAAQKEVVDAFTISVGQQISAIRMWWSECVLALQKSVIDHPFNLVAGLKEIGAINAALESQKKIIADLAAKGTKELIPKSKDIQQAVSDFSALSTLLEQIQGKTSAFGNDADKAVEQITKLQREAQAAADKFVELQKVGKLTADDAKREASALADIPDAILALTNALTDQITAKRKELADKQNAAILAAADSLREKLNAQREKGWQEELAAFELEMTKLRDHLSQKGQLTTANEALLDEVLKDGINKRQKAQGDAWAKELLTLQGHLASMVTANLTSAQKILFQYDQDLVKFSQIEELKSQKLASSEAERLTIAQLYELNRKALYTKEQNDLNALANSKGWQAVLGNEFGSLLKNDEAAWKQWSESSDQATQMVKLSLVALNQEAETAFTGFEKGMASSITQAVVYSTSIGQAMQKATAAALESLASQALSQAIFTTALGFERLAQYDTAGAQAAFESAAMFGLLAGGSAVAGRAIAGPQSSTGSGGSAPGTGPGSTPSNQPTLTPLGASMSQANNSGYVRININGSVIGASGIDELASMINDAVQNRDVRFIASNVKNATPVTR